MVDFECPLCGGRGGGRGAWSLTGCPTGGRCGRRRGAPWNRRSGRTGDSLPEAALRRSRERSRQCGDFRRFGLRRKPLRQAERNRRRLGVACGEKTLGRCRPPESVCAFGCNPKRCRAPHSKAGCARTAPVAVWDAHGQTFRTVGMNACVDPGSFPRISERTTRLKQEGHVAVPGGSFAPLRIVGG
jgi:hypothetical protein